MFCGGLGKCTRKSKGRIGIVEEEAGHKHGMFFYIPPTTPRILACTDPAEGGNILFSEGVSFLPNFTAGWRT
jgi:hypothetical protein